MAGQLTAGEHLFYGEIISAYEGDTRFKLGDTVYYSEYSSASLFDYAAVVDGSKTFSDAKKEGLVIVAEDDIMAYDITEVSGTTKKNRP